MGCQLLSIRRSLVLLTEDATRTDSSLPVADGRTKIDRCSGPGHHPSLRTAPGSPRAQVFNPGARSPDRGDAVIVASISSFPVDKGPSLGRYVKKAIDALEGTGLKVHVGPMETTVEAPDLEAVLGAIRAAHNAIAEQGSVRILTTVKIDDRRDREHTIERKLRAVGR